MTDDLVKRLREADIYDYDTANEICNEAADRIEALEKALTVYACNGDCKNCYGSVQDTGFCGNIARAALGEKKDVK